MTQYLRKLRGANHQKKLNYNYLTDCHLKFGDMKKEFRVIVDHQRNGEDKIRDELTVCRWEEA